MDIGTRLLLEFHRRTGLMSTRSTGWRWSGLMYVASQTLQEPLPWNGTLLEGDVAEADVR